MTSGNIVQDLISLTSQALVAVSDRVGYQLSLRYGVQIRKFLESPQLLDPHMSSLLVPLIKHLEHDMEAGKISKAWVYTILYLLIDVRHLDALTCYFPNAVANLEPCIHLLALWYNESVSIASLDQKDSTDGATEMVAPSFNVVYDEKDVSANAKQHVIYVLFACLSILVRVPFDIKSVDSDGSMPNTIAILTKRAFASGTKEYIVAAETMAQFVTRPDLRDSMLPSIIADINAYISEYALKLEAAAKDEVAPILKRGKTATVNQTPAYLILLSYIIRFSDREHIKALGDKVLEAPEKTLSILLKDDNREVRRLCIVLATRLATIYLPHNPFGWRNELLNAESAGMILYHNKILELEGFYVPEAFDYFIDSLLISISDNDTGIRLASARGIALIIGRLPYMFSDEVIAEIISYFSPAETSEMWHGANMALGEVIRHGYLPPCRIPEVYSLVEKSLQFERKRGASSIVKDAACFVSWTLARNYASCSHLHEVCRELASELLIVACFDREVNIRRSAAAAFQELAGRVGEPYVPAAVCASALVDYFSLGSKKVSYLDVAPQLAALDGFYASTLVDAICNRYLVHWDGTIRDLAARALPSLLRQKMQHVEKASGTASAEMSALDTVHFLKDCLSNVSCEEDWVSYCGFVLGISSCVQFLCSMDDNMVTELNKLISYLSLNHSELFKLGKRFKDNAEANATVIKSTSTLIREFVSTDPLHTGQSILNKKTYATYFLYLLHVLESSIIATVDSMSIAMLDTSNTNEVILAMRTLAAYYDRWEEVANAQEAIQAEQVPTFSSVFFKDCINSIDHKSSLAHLTGLGLFPTSFRRKEADYIFSAISKELEKGITPSGYVIRLYILSTLERTLLALDTITAAQEHAAQKILNACLHDYSSNQRGDVGSLVRLKTFRVIRTILRENKRVGLCFMDLYMEAIIRFMGSRIDVMRIDALISLFEDHQDGILQLEEDFARNLKWYMQDYIREKEILSAMREKTHISQRKPEERDESKYIYDLHCREARDDDLLADDANVNLLTLVPKLSFTAINVLTVLFMMTPKHMGNAASSLTYAFGASSETTAAYMIRLILEVFGKHQLKTLVTGSTTNRISMHDNLKEQLKSLPELARPALYQAIDTSLSTYTPSDSYLLNMVDAALNLLNFLLANGVYIEDDATLFAILGSILNVAKKASNLRILQLVTGCLAGAGVVAHKAGYVKTHDRAVKGLILLLSHKISKLRAAACDGLLEILLLSAGLNDKIRKKAVEILTKYDWPVLSVEEVTAAREEFCTIIRVAPPSLPSKVNRS